MFNIMTSMRRFLLGLLFAALPCALAAQSARGAGYTTTTTTDSGGRKTTLTVQTEVLGSKFRMAMKSDAVGPTPVEFYQLWDSTAATITQVMPAAAMAMVMPSSLLSSSMAAMPAFLIETDTAPKYDLVDLGAGEKTLGYATRHYRQTVAYTMKITIGGETCRKPHREVSEIWTTIEVKLPDLNAVMLRFTGGTGVRVMTPGALKLDSIKNEGVRGTVLRRIGTVTSVGAGGDTLRVTSKMEITAINADSVDAHDFEVPAGYNVMDMSATMANLGVGALQETMLLSMKDRFKKTLCGEP